MGTIAFRISMILTTLRILETGEVSDTIYCSNEDYESTITIVKALIKHSSKVYSSLPVDKTAVKYKNKKEQFIDSLPLHFTTQQFQKKAKKLEITSKTAERYITDLCKSNVLVRESQGNYYNPNKEEVKGDEGTEEI
jgi:predicted HTH transcriptional regulator